MAQAGGVRDLDEASIARLPPDAPEGHASFKNGVIKCTTDSGGGVLLWFWIPSLTKVRFQVTARAAGDSIYAAERIARACYVKFEEGLDKEEVLKIRKEWYDALAPAKPPKQPSASSSSGGRKRKQEEMAAEAVASAPAEAKAKKQDEVAEAGAGAGAENAPAEAATSSEAAQPQVDDSNEQVPASAKSSEGQAKPAMAKGTEAAPPSDAALLDLLPPDAPEDHIAHRKCTWRASTRSAGFKYENKIPFQVTLMRAGSEAATLHLARVCYMKFEQGMTKEQVQEIRDGIYKEIANRGLNLAALPAQGGEKKPKQERKEKKDKKDKDRKEEKSQRKASKGASKAAKSGKKQAKQQAAASKASEEKTVVSSSEESDESESSTSGSSSPAAAEAGTTGGGPNGGPLKSRWTRVAAKAAVRAGYRCACHYARVCPGGGGAMRF